MGRLIIFEWISFDGIFDADTMGDWWDPYNTPERQQCITDVYLHTDAFLMGRVTHSTLAPYWSQLGDDEMGGVAGKLNRTRKYVVSTTGRIHPWSNSMAVGATAHPIDVEVARIKEDAKETVVIGSATLVETLMQADLIDEYKFLVQPVIAGNGKRFFQDGMKASLQLAEQRTLDRGVLYVHFVRG